jgi:hypothetical protein
MQQRTMREEVKREWRIARRALWLDRLSLPTLGFITAFLGTLLCTWDQLLGAMMWPLAFFLAVASAFAAIAMAKPLYLVYTRDVREHVRRVLLDEGLLLRWMNSEDPLPELSWWRRPLASTQSAASRAGFGSRTAILFEQYAQIARKHGHQAYPVSRRRRERIPYLALIALLAGMAAVLTVQLAGGHPPSLGWIATMFWPLRVLFSLGVFLVGSLYSINSITREATVMAVAEALIGHKR